jgi:cellulose synthase/poly-beta-1,6-N-acetylglucosamine synthase-like glycosyltransferase
MVETVGAAAKETAADAAASQLLFVIPAYNEEANLPTLFADLLQAEPLLGEGSRILIVDDGSADETPALVEAYEGPLPVELVRLEQNQGRAPPSAPASRPRWSRRGRTP